MNIFKQNAHMPESPSFSSLTNLENQKKEAQKIREKYPDRIPCIVEKAKHSNLAMIDKKKYLVPTELTLGQFQCIIRKRLKISQNQAIYFFINGDILAPASSIMENLYNEHKGENDFLTIIYAAENTFGY